MIDFLSNFLPEITQNVTNSIAPSVFVSDCLCRLPSIKEGRTAMYVSSSDIVYIPNSNDFNTENEYYRTLFHELIHSTGHKNRLNRHLGNNFEDYYYTHEELIAEFGSILLSSQCGIFTDNIPLHYQYINEWYRVLWFYSCGKTINESIDYCIKQARLSVEFLRVEKL